VLAIGIRTGKRDVWSRIAALAGAALLLVSLVVPVTAAGPNRLSGADVSPRTGTPTTTIVATVWYRSNDGSEPEWVRVAFDGATHDMSALPGGSWKDGVQFSWTGSLPSGVRSVVFTSLGRHDQFLSTLAAGTVTIEPPPTPTPTPTPAPTPAPTPMPTPAPTPVPTPTPAPTPTPKPTPTPTPVPTPTPLATPTPTPPATPTPTPRATPTPAGTPAATPIPGTAPQPTPTPVSGAFPSFVPSGSGGPTDPGTPSGPNEPGSPGSGPFPGSWDPQSPGDGTQAPGQGGPGYPPVTTAGGSTDGSTGGTGGTGGADPNAPGDGASRSPSNGSTNSAGGSGGSATWGPLASTLSALGIETPTFGWWSAVPTLVTTTGTVAMAMAFGLFGKRRRDGEPPAPNEVLAAAAAVGVGVGAIVLPPESDIEAAEAMMPRWRRPSLMQARKADPIRDYTPVARLSFDKGLVGPLDGHERRFIRYRVVRMLDSPDELRGTETGYLDRGDEVQLLEKYGAYWLVLCPDGRQGWVHNMTLGEVVDDQAPEPDRPVATMPLAAETWTMGESDDDSDVLEAYLESRRREA